MVYIRELTKEDEKLQGVINHLSNRYHVDYNYTERIIQTAMEMGMPLDNTISERFCGILGFIKGEYVGNENDVNMFDITEKIWNT